MRKHLPTVAGWSCSLKTLPCDEPLWERKDVTWRSFGKLKLEVMIVGHGHLLEELNNT